MTKTVFPSSLSQSAWLLISVAATPAKSTEAKRTLAATTIKYGDPADLQEYNGGRTFDDIKKHAETLGPSCSPANIDLCDDAKKADIKKFQAMSSDDREKQIKEKEEAMKKIEGDFEKFVEGLNKQYKEQSEKKDKDLAAIKDSGLSLLKSVNKFEANKKGEL